jgi:hypothetical protein
MGHRALALSLKSSIGDFLRKSKGKTNGGGPVGVLFGISYIWAGSIDPPARNRQCGGGLASTVMIKQAGFRMTR